MNVVPRFSRSEASSSGWGSLPMRARLSLLIAGVLSPASLTKSDRPYLISRAMMSLYRLSCSVLKSGNAITTVTPHGFAANAGCLRARQCRPDDCC